MIEVADSSLEYDRELKLPRYARAGIPEVWLVDLNARRLTVHRRPADDGYAQVVILDDRSSVFLPLDEHPPRSADLTSLF